MSSRALVSLLVVLVAGSVLAGENGRKPSGPEWPNHRGAGSAGMSPDGSVKPPLKLVWSYRCDSDTSGDACAGSTIGKPVADRSPSATSISNWLLASRRDP